MRLRTNESTIAGAVSHMTLVLVATLLMAAPTPARADIVDSDEDGVADAADACPDTDPADLVGPDGCVIASCELGLDGSGWSSRRAYLAYVTSGAKGANAAGTMTGRALRALVRRARNSTCGSPDLVRCCVFTFFDDEVGRCRIMTEDACDTLDDRLFDTDGEADDEEAGSCLPNPCTF
jgi:hypothetical protein